MSSDEALPDAVTRAMNSMTPDDLARIADQSSDAAWDLMNGGMISIGPFVTRIVNGQIVTEIVG